MGYRYRKKNYRRKRRTVRRYKRTTFGQRVKKTLFRYAESKYQDYNSGNVTIGAGTRMFTVDPMQLAAGAGQGQRIGNKVYVTWIHVKIDVNSNAQPNEYIRFGFYRWKGFAAIPDNTFLPTDHLAFADQEEWTIIRDKVFNVGDGGADGRNKVFKSMWIKINKTIQFDSPAVNTYAKPFIMFLNSNDGALPSPNGYLYFRIYFKDI